MKAIHIEESERSAQFNSFLNRANFELAYKRLQTAGRDLYKSLYIEDARVFGLHLEKNTSNLIHQISEGYYRYQGSYKYYLPKKSGMVRPITLMNFTDLLIFQAIMNIIAKETVNDLSGYYNKVIYGNILNDIDMDDSIFFYKPWKKQWKSFSESQDLFYESGYTFLCEFDISSFFDTVNHQILQQMLEGFNISNDLILFLVELLRYCTKDNSRNSYYSSSGIPQGPIASSYLADLYLHYIDRKLVLNTLGTNASFKYIRYVDDIRIYTKSPAEREKRLAQLDLLSRDIGLIPQSSKILRREMENPEREIRSMFKQFSKWADEYKRNCSSLSEKSHNKLKKRLFNSYEASPFNIDKTTLNFSLYRLNKDNDIKEFLLTNLVSLAFCFEAVLFYLNRYFSADIAVKDKIKDIMSNKDVLYNHLYALVFKNFDGLDFNEKIFTYHYVANSEYWLKRYYMIDWLHRTNQYELIKRLEDDNPYVQKRILKYKAFIVQDNIIRKMELRKAIKSKNDLIALQAIYYYSEEFTVDYILTNHGLSGTSEFNSYIKNIIKNQKSDIITHIFKDQYEIINADKFFNPYFFANPDAFIEMKKSLYYFYYYRNVDPSVSFMNLNNFNHVLINEITDFVKEKVNSKDYGPMLEEIKWANNLYSLRKTFIEINNWRNQKTYSHPYNKDGHIRIKIKYSELESFIAKEVKAIEELILYFTNDSENKNAI